MKLSVLLVPSFLFMVSFAKEFCMPKRFSDGTNCVYLTFEYDKPLTLNTSYQILSIFLSEGSIGIKTFSLMTNLVELRIVSSKIDQIEDGALCSLPKLERLIIEDNDKFPPLRQSMLNNCGNIKSFKLAQVKIEPGTFKGMTSLEELEMRHIDIPRLTKEYFEPLKNLKSLELLICKIDEIDAGSICLSPKLKFFVMNGNTAVPPLTKHIFANCNSVDDFRFKFHEHLPVVVEEEAFSGFENPKRTDLDYLRIEHLTKRHLSGLANTEILYITFSNITKIDADAFQGFNRLRQLYLYSNYLTEIDPELLASLPNLTYLDLGHNNLTSIDKLSNPKLEALYVHSNTISKIDTSAVKSNLPRLNTLKISNNGMTSEYENVVRNDLHDVSVIGTYDPKDFTF